MSAHTTDNNAEAMSRSGPASHPDLSYFGGEEVLQCPYPFYRSLLTEAPVARLPNESTYLISRYNDVIAVLDDRDSFSSQRPWEHNLCAAAQDILNQGWPSPTLLVGEDPPTHTFHRRLAMPAFSRKRLADLSTRMRMIANELVDSFSSDGRADFVTQYAEPLPLRVLGEIMQIPPEEGVVFRKWAHDMLDIIAGGLSPEREVECAVSTVKFQRFIKDHVDRRRAQPDESVISDLIQARDDEGNGLSESEIINLLCVFLRAGFETAVQLLGNMMLELLRNPDQLTKLRTDPTLASKVVEEVMRIESPVQRVVRYVTRDSKIGGVDVPKGAKLILLIGAASRDEATFPNSSTFDIVRKGQKTHVGFGFGSHFCIGAPIARDEARITLEVVLERLKNLRLDPNTDGYTYKPNRILRGLKHLPILFDK